jgi:CheY-like chemotaxis protein
VTALAPELGTVKADPGQLEQVLLNLVVNARDAMPGGGRLTIETANVELDEAFVQAHRGARPGPYVRLTVTDTGIGMDAETQTRIFEPFFTTKEPGRGTGLGLATVYGIVKQTDGYVAVTSAPGQGARFDVYLPRVAAAAEPGPRPTSLSTSPGGTESVLLVEDDAALGELAREILESAGYTVLGASSGLEAVALAEARSGPIHIVVTDVVMPQLSGPDTVRRLQAARSELKCLFMSGYTGDRLTGQDLRDAALLRKPFAPAALLAGVREVLDRRSPG